MAGSQLKRLKASLREQGIIGPQQSKKQRKRKAEDERANNVKRLDKATKLQHIRESYNPFDLKHDVRGPKFQVTTNRPATGNAAKGIQGRPSEAKTAGEETRRKTLLVEMQRRNKIGGIHDRRFGEDDPSMAPEDKALERFAMEKQRSHKRDVFDLEDDAGVDFGLTHMGKSLSLDGPNLADDYNEDELDVDSDGSANDEGEKAYLKRKQLTDGEYVNTEAEDGQPERKRSKNEIMKEVIAKSKFHKYERQAEKDADEDLRMELDKDLPHLQQLLYSKGKLKSTTLEEQEKEKFDRDYDLRVKQLALSRRAQPTERTKTAEERAEEEASRLKELEEKRVKRMHGQAESESEHGDSDAPEEERERPNGPIQFIEHEEDDSFGLGKGIKTLPTASELGFEDEDNFYIEDNLVADGSDLSPVESDESSDEESGNDDGEEQKEEEEEEDEFTKGLLTELEIRNPVFSIEHGSAGTTSKEDPNILPFCPETHEQLLELTEKVPITSLPALVQRIRAQYRPQLDNGNKSKLGNFAVVLVQHVAYLSSLPQLPPFSVLETLIRHIHSLAKSHAVQLANAFRSHLLGTKPLDPQLGDLVILTAVSTIFPTSDHWHQVASPAMLVIGKYLGQKIPTLLTDYTKGCYMSILALQFQKMSKRCVPEVHNFVLNAVASLAPVKSKEKLGSFPLHEPAPGMRILDAQAVRVKKLTCFDCVEAAVEDNGLKVAVVDTAVKIIDISSNLWSEKPSFFETFQPASNVLAHLQSKSCRIALPKALNESIAKTKLKIDGMLQKARIERRPLELHHHRPQAIKSSFPKFEDSFDPTKHYDPDRERAELAKLKAEHKRERKGVLRELRKDANFTAREKLRVKKVKDAAYEKKYKRLVAEIQGEEGREANAYEREKEQRKKASKRG